ncbi:MAG: hypothetical protein SVW02_02525 [Candidatus Nanohaloarchaea archaeon]|nr:hypothetical protein [Candidatus Nanohaloarchaea archaeon]
MYRWGETMDIDNIDFSIIKAVATTDEPLWKKQVHRRIKEERDTLPLDREISVQTIGRRIDELKEAGLLEPCIVNPEDINRDLIIAYHSTDRGEELLREKRDTMLREFAAEVILPASGDRPSPATVADLAHRKFGVERDVLDRMVERDETYLSAVIAYAYLKEAVEDVMTEEDVERFGETVHENDRLVELLSGTAFRRQMRRQVEDAEQSYLWEDQP